MSVGSTLKIVLISQGAMNSVFEAIIWGQLISSGFK